MNLYIHSTRFLDRERENRKNGNQESRNKEKGCNHKEGSQEDLEEKVSGLQK
jgi:hypothetical protein